MKNVKCKCGEITEVFENEPDFICPACERTVVNPSFKTVDFDYDYGHD